MADEALHPPCPKTQPHKGDREGHAGKRSEGSGWSIPSARAARCISIVFKCGDCGAYNESELV
jgi:hypothetical protein